MLENKLFGPYVSDPRLGPTISCTAQADWMLSSLHFYLELADRQPPLNPLLRYQRAVDFESFESEDGKDPNPFLSNNGFHGIREEEIFREAEVPREIYDGYVNELSERVVQFGNFVDEADQTPTKEWVITGYGYRLVISRDNVGHWLWWNIEKELGPNRLMQMRQQFIPPLEGEAGPEDPLVG